MRSLSRSLVWLVGGIATCMIVIVSTHIGGIIALRIGQFAPVIGAFIGGTLVLASTVLPKTLFTTQTDYGKGSERISWFLIGLGIIAWGLGDSIWRYYIYTNQSPFPSYADIGYSSLPPLIFIGLLLQPSSGIKWKRIVLSMDCLVAMGSILAIAWYLLLGNLAQAPGENNLGKILGLYYPISDIALLSCVVFLLLRNQAAEQLLWAQRVSLLLVGIGLCFFITSDFIFNIKQNAGTYVEATWTDLGWALGMIIMGIAAWLRRFPPAVPTNLRSNRVVRPRSISLSPFQFIPYVLVAGLFLVLTLNVLSADKGQQAIRPVLVIVAIIVVCVIIARQIFTIQENMQLLQEQEKALHHLHKVNSQIEAQSQQITEQKLELERGINHLKDVHASLANGNFRARATLTRGDLWPLAASLNLMAERWTRVGQDIVYIQRLRKTLDQLSGILERKAPILITDVYNDFPEINRLVKALFKQGEEASPPQEPSPMFTTPPSVANSTDSVNSSNTPRTTTSSSRMGRPARLRIPRGEE